MTAPPIPAPGARWALFLDVDGTLAAIAPTPGAVHVEPALPPLLERLRVASDGALAVMSGRRLEDIDALFRPLVLPAGGLHGLERRRADGTVIEVLPPHEILDGLRPALAAFAAAREGVLFEDKGRTLALHYRLAPRYGAAVRLFARRLHRRTDEHLRLIEGRKVVEFQPLGCDKGRAIAAFLEEPPFAGRLPVFVGDDTTDEDGFATVNRHGGISVRVQGPHRAPAATAARFALPSVTAVHDWLARVALALEGGTAPALAHRAATISAERRRSLPR